MKVFFNPVLPSTHCVGPLSFRDHRKIMVCDELGFCGGMNIQDASYHGMASLRIAFLTVVDGPTRFLIQKSMSVGLTRRI